MSAADQADILDVDQAAQLLRCEPGTVRDQARAGDLPGLKPGRDWIFPRAALLQHLTERALAEAAKRRSPSADERRQPTAVLQAVPAARKRKGPPVLPGVA